MRTVLCFLAITLFGTSFAQESEIQIVENVAVISRMDGFTDESTLIFIMPTVGVTVSETGALPDRYIQLECTNGAMDGISFQFDIYLNSGELGAFQYRLDGGEVQASEEWQSDSQVTLFVSPGELSDNSEDIKDILGGTEILVRATAFDGDIDDARFNLTGLKSAMSQVGCSYPQ